MPSAHPTRCPQVVHVSTTICLRHRYHPCTNISASNPFAVDGIRYTKKWNPLTNVNFQIHCILYSSTVDWSKRNKWQWPSPLSCLVSSYSLPSHSFIHIYIHPNIFIQIYSPDIHYTHIRHSACVPPEPSQKLKFGCWTIQHITTAKKQGNQM